MTDESTSSTIDRIAARVRAIAAAHGLEVTGESRSALSCARYLLIRKPWGHFDQPRGLRRRFCAQTGMSYPRFMPLGVRIADHRGYGGDGAHAQTHLTVRIDGDHDVEATMARLDAALALLVSA